MRISNVSASYWKRSGFLRKDKFWALKNVSFEINHGETLGIIGRNGVGKSTLLRLLAGIIVPDSGEIELFDCNEASLLSLQVGFIGHLNGRENAILSDMLLGMSRQYIEEHLVEITEYSELGDFFEQPVNTYSAGMKARLGFSISFLANPDILLLDEVLGVGDESFREKSTHAMKERMKSNKTIVLVSHNANMIRDLCDRVVWIEEGMTKKEGNAVDVIDEYSDFMKERMKQAKKNPNKD
jgi:lipopolysaccharide transport system ATP-binding protein